MKKLYTEMLVVSAICLLTFSVFRADDIVYVPIGLTIYSGQSLSVTQDGDVHFDPGGVMYFDQIDWFSDFIDAFKIDDLDDGDDLGCGDSN